MASEQANKRLTLNQPLQNWTVVQEDMSIWSTYGRGKSTAHGLRKTQSHVCSWKFFLICNILYLHLHL